MTKKTSQQLATTNTTAMTTAASKAIVQATETIEQTLAQCDSHALAKLPPITQAVQLAQGMHAIRQAMSDEVVQAVFMPLQGSPLGFTTDRDSAKDGPKKYGIDVVRDVMIEGMIKGLRPIGNEMMIISGRLYSPKNGLKRMVKEFPGLTDLEIEIGVPVSGQDGALVSAVAKWQLDGQTMEVRRGVEQRPDGTRFDNRIPIRVNKAMGIDAIRGKAERKLFHDVYERIAGSAFAVQDADLEDGPAQIVQPPEAPQLEPSNPPAQPEPPEGVPAPEKKGNGGRRRKASLKRPSDPKETPKPAAEPEPEPQTPPAMTEDGEIIEEGEVAEEDAPQMSLV